MKALILVACFMLLASLIYAHSVRADTMIDNCTNITTSGTYFLTEDIINTDNNACMNITASDVYLDCQGHAIDGQNLTTQFGIGCADDVNWEIVCPDLTNITIRNCNVSDFPQNIEFMYNLSNSLFENNILSNSSCAGLYMDSWNGDEVSENITFRNNTFIFNSLSSEGCSNISLSYQIIDVENITITNNTFRGNKFDLKAITNQNKFTVYNNVFYDIIGFSNGGIFIWNTTLGNYWTNSTANGYSDICTDANTDGFCDSPYDVEANAPCMAGVDCGNNTDYLPLSDEYVAPTPSPNPLENLTVAYTYCLTNNTLALINHTNEYGNITTSYLNCANGCDNTTTSCNPAKWQSNLIILVIISLVIIGLYKLYRWI